MKNLICPACNTILLSKESNYKCFIYRHDSNFECKIRVYVESDLDYCVSLEDEKDYYIKYNFSDDGSNPIIRYIGSEHIELDFVIDNYIDAYKTLISYKENMIFE